MRKIRHVLKLAWESGLTKRQIARSLAMSPTTVGEYLRRAEDARLAWPLPPDWDNYVRLCSGSLSTKTLIIVVNISFKKINH